MTKASEVFVLCYYRAGNGAAVRNVKRSIVAYVIAIGSLSLFLALPGMSIGIYSGNVLYFVLGYLATLLFIFAAFFVVLFPFLPLMVFVSSSDALAKSATIVLLPAYFVLIDQVGGVLVGSPSIDRVRGVWERADALLPYAVVPAMIIVLNFFVIEAAMRRRDAGRAVRQ